MKKVIGMCLAAVLAVSAAQTTNMSYNIKKLPASSTPTMDGLLGEWPEAYFVDTLQHYNNVYAMDESMWYPSNIQFRVYMAHDDAKVYIGVKIVTDNVLVSTVGLSGTMSSCSGDNIKINPGGQAAGFYVFCGGQVMKNKSCAYTEGSTMWAYANVAGNGTGRPTYEVALAKDVSDPFGLGSFQSSVGVEDADGPVSSPCNVTTFVGVGAWNTGVKSGSSSYNNNPWDNSALYPTWNLTTDEGPAMGTAAEKANLSTASKVTISSNPNPFTATTSLTYSSKEAGTVKVFNAAGKMVFAQQINAGHGSVQFNGAKLSSGVYVARIESGKNIANTKLFLTR